MTVSETFQLKSDFLPLTVLKLCESDLTQFDAELTDTIEKAPRYFIHAPIILDISDAKASTDFITELCAILRKKKIFPVGIRGLANGQEHIAYDNQLAIFQPAKSLVEQVKAPAAPAKPTPPASSPSNASKLIHQPVRAGSTVYAKQADLVILSSVNAGAECIADGNIHIYGALRGRALAGAHGDESARIFCNSLEAELVSIAGHYLVKDNIHVPKGCSRVQIYLDDNQLKIEGI